MGIFFFENKRERRGEKKKIQKINQFGMVVQWNYSSFPKNNKTKQIAWCYIVAKFSNRNERNGYDEEDEYRVGACARTGRT